MADTSTPDTMATLAPADAADDAPLTMSPEAPAPSPGQDGGAGKPKRRRPLPLRLLKLSGIVIGALLLLVILVAGGAVAALQIQACQDLLRGKLNAMLQDEKGGVEITALSGAIPLDMEAGLRLKDREGVWLEIPRARVALDLSAPLTRIGLAVSADDGRLLRAAIADDAPSGEVPPAEPLTPASLRAALDSVARIGEAIPDQVPAVAITEVAIRNFRVNRPVFAPAPAPADGAAPAEGADAAGSPASAARAEAQAAPSVPVADALALDVLGALSVTPGAKDAEKPGWADPALAGRFEIVLNAAGAGAAPARAGAEIAAAGITPPADPLERGPAAAAAAKSLAASRVTGPALEVVPGARLNGVVVSVDIFGSLARPGLVLAAAVPELRSAIVASDTALSVVLPPETIGALAAGEEGGLRVTAAATLDGEAVEAGFDARCALRDDGISAALRDLAVRIPGITVDGGIATVLPPELLAGTAPARDGVESAPPAPGPAAAPQAPSSPAGESAAAGGETGAKAGTVIAFTPPDIPALIPDLSGLPPVTGFLNVDARSFDLLSRAMPGLTLGGTLGGRIGLASDAAAGQTVTMAVSVPELLVRQEGQEPMTVSALAVDVAGDHLYTDAAASVDVRLGGFSGMGMSVSDLAVTLKGDGFYSNARADADVRLKGFSGMDMSVSNLSVDLRGDSFYSNPAASVDVTLDSFAGAGAEASNLVATLVGSNCYADPEASFAVTVDSASASGMTVRAVKASGTGNTIFTSPEAKLAVTVDSVSGNDLALSDITLEGTGRDFFNDPGGKVDVRLANFAGQGLNVTDATVSLDGALSSGIDFVVATAGDVITAIKGHMTDGNVDISQLATSVTPYGVGISSTSPLRVAYGPGSVKVTGLALDFAPGGHLSAEAEVGDNVCVARGNIDNIDFTAYRHFVEALPEGALSADFDIKGTLAEPTGTFNVNVTGLRMDGLDLPALDVGLKTLLGRDEAGSRVLAEVVLPEATLEALGGESSKIQVRLPLKSGGSSPAPDMDGKLTGVVQYKGNVSKLWKLAGQPDRRLTGDIVVDAAIGGSLNAPDPSGGVKFVSGKFVDADLGVQVDAINLDARLEGSGADLAKRKAAFTLTATDGRQGKLNVAGSSGLTGDNLSVRTTLAEFAPLRRRDIRALLSGDVSVSGSATNPAVTGEVRVNKGWLSIEALDLPPGVETLPIEENYAPGGGSAQAAADGGGEASSSDFGSIDLRFTMPPSFRVFGWGLDTVWKADLAIRGALTNPSISGEVLANRGTLDLLSRKFTLSTGSVKFAGNVEPVLDIQMVRETADLEACVNIAGTARKIDLSLTSTPSMEQEEIISQMLFGKNSSELSQYELLQLGAAVAKLAAFGTGSGAVDAVRDVAGLDVLSVGQSDGGGARLEMGKYMMENLYVGVEKSTGDEDVTSGIVQWEIGPRTNANIKSGGGNTEAGLQWKMDY